MATLSHLLSRLDLDPQTRGRQFEHIAKWYLRHDPKYGLQLRRIWLWDEWPERWGPDAGIDLVAETHDRDLWAIQAKARRFMIELSSATMMIRKMAPRNSGTARVPRTRYRSQKNIKATSRISRMSIQPSRCKYHKRFATTQIGPN